MTKCVFCGREEHSFKGISLIKNDGTVNYFCSGKCRKNAIKLGRDKKRFKWTEAFRVERQKVGEEAKKLQVKTAAKKEAQKEAYNESQKESQAEEKAEKTEKAEKAEKEKKGKK